MNTTFTITSSTSSSSLIILSLFNSRIVPFVSAVIARCSYPCVYAEFFVSVKNFLTGTRPPHFVSCPPRDAQSENINWFHTHCLFARNPTNFSSLKTKNKKPTAHVVVVVVVDATSSIQIWYRFDDKLFTCSRTIFFF